MVPFSLSAIYSHCFLCIYQTGVSVLCILGKRFLLNTTPTRVTPAPCLLSAVHIPSATLCESHMTHSCYIQKRMCRKVRVALDVIILRPPGSAVQIKNTGPLQGHCAESRKFGPLILAEQLFSSNIVCFGGIRWPIVVALCHDS